MRALLIIMCIITLILEPGAAIPLLFIVAILVCWETGGYQKNTTKLENKG